MQEFKRKYMVLEAALIISNKEINDIMKIIQTVKNSNILPEGVTKAAKNEISEQRGGCLGILMGTVASILLGNILSGKGIVRTGSGNKKEKRNCISWLWKKMGFLIPPQPLTNFEI